MMQGYIREHGGKKLAGYVMAGVGFLMVLVNALAYVLGWNGEHTPLLIIGLVLGATGLNLTRKR